MGIFTQRGLNISHDKRTSGMKAVRMEQCERVTLLMKQHIGAACVPCVKPGDRVLVGQLVGDSQANVSAPVHASISGTVKKIELVRLPDGGDVPAVVIESDGLMEHIDYKPPVIASREDFLAAVRASGLVGLGGAGYPAHAKLRGSVGKVEIMIINGAECEPFATPDHREMLDAAPDVIEGIRQLCRWMDIKKVIIGIENNKPDAIDLLRRLSAEASTPDMQIAVGVVPSRYPQGANKQLVKTLVKRTIPLGGRLSDVGLLMMNVVSTAFLGRYLRTGKPLITRTVTLDGDAVAKPMNARVPIGVSLRELCAFCGAGDVTPAKIVIGGPMMGAAVPDMDAVIQKCSNAVLLFTAAMAAPRRETACIRCGRCVAVCPMSLQPFLIEQASRVRDLDELARLHADGCIECGCCSYTCPAGRELVQRIRMGKWTAKEAKQKEKEKSQGVKA